MQEPPRPTQGIAVVIFEDSTRDMSRPYRALLAAKEFQDAGDDVAVIFDGSGVETLAAASSPAHGLHRLVEQLRPAIRGACGHCARSHGVEAAVTAAGWPLLTDYRGHASFRELVLDGYQIINF